MPPLQCLWHSFRFSYPRLKAIQITLFEERCLGGTLQPFNRPWMIRSQPRLSLVRIMDNSRIANGPFYIFFFLAISDTQLLSEPFLVNLGPVYIPDYGTIFFALINSRL